MAEWISEDADLRKVLRNLMFDEGVVVSRKSIDAVDEQEKFKMYYEYKEPVKTIPSHRMLAIRRGESENVLYFLIEIEHGTRHRSAAPACLARSRATGRRNWKLAIDDAWKRLLNSSIQAEIRLELKRRSDTEAIKVFRDNLYNLLLAPPAGPISVLGIDPGLRTGCKVAVVDETGKLLAHDVLYLHTSKHGNAEAMPKLESHAADIQCARHRDWQRYGIARDGRVCARVSARQRHCGDLFGYRQRSGRQRLLGVGCGAAGIP